MERVVMEREWKKGEKKDGRERGGEGIEGQFASLTLAR